MINMKKIKITIKNKDYFVKAEDINNQIWFHWDKKIFVLNKIVKKTSIIDSPKIHNSKNVILSPMPGQIIKILVSVGEKVRENQNLLIFSSMKMEYTLQSPQKGIVKSMAVKENQKVSADQILIEITKIK